MIATRREFAGLAALASAAATSANACDIAGPPAWMTGDQWQRRWDFLEKYPDTPAGKTFAHRFVEACAKRDINALAPFFAPNATVPVQGENLNWRRWHARDMRGSGDWKMISSFNGGNKLCIRASQTVKNDCGSGQAYWLFAMLLDKWAPANVVRISSMEAIYT